ncbi:MAG TPA: 3-hydroxybutyrate dehydrogenase [Geminicoccaceae bacterium]|jgi:3-hydroxybutyrate dehydrogenase|nr:3-hydroxybutyrate dehydrogenase [Geminicoccaceae bacterium]
MADISDPGLRGRSALVTGSTSGIGLGIATALAQAGVNVTLNGLGDAQSIERTRADLAERTGVTVRHSGADMSKGDEVVAMVQEAESAHGAVDILVNNAGIQFVAPIEEFPAAKWEAILAINLSHAYYAIHAAVPGMRQRGFGRIVNIASAHGLVASPYKAAYVAAKHGMVGLTKVVALETAEDDITCNAICPGFVQTSLVEGQIDEQAKAHGLPRERVIKEVILASQPSKRFVEVTELARLTLFLCTDAGRSITGAALPVDGGWTAR